MSTAPWSGDLEQLLRSSLEHRWTVAVTDAAGNPIPLKVSTCSVTLDRSWSPYVQGVLTGPVPQDQAELDALDPRGRVKVVVSAGYVLPGAVVDVHPLAVMYLARRDVDRPSNTLTLSVQGAEYLYDGWRALSNSAWAGASWDNTTTARDAVNRCLIACGAVSGITDPSWAYGQALTSTRWADAAPEQWVPAATDPALDFARDIAARVGGWFRCDETGVWRLTGQSPVGQPVHALNVGAAGTVVSSSTELTRDRWANAAVVRYRWDKAGLTQTVIGTAQITSGPYATSVVGQVTAADELPWKSNAVAAANRAAATLRTAFTLGRAITISAVAAYWIRPLDTVSIQLPLGPQERHQVGAVTFTLETGSMDVRTQLPLDDTITGG